MVATTESTEKLVVYLELDLWTMFSRLGWNCCLLSVVVSRCLWDRYNHSTITCTHEKVSSLSIIYIITRDHGLIGFRFVEKKKLTRRLKKAETNQEKEKVERQIRYVDYYPVDIKYLALFPHLEAAKELEKSEGAEKDTFAETTTTASVEAILSKIDAFHEKGLVVPGFTWRWNQKTTNEEDDQAILNNKDSTTMEQDDFFVM